jgi:hypothetical protein
LIQILCDRDGCGQLIQDGSERYDITLMSRRDNVSRQQIAGKRFFFHPTCYVASGPVTPAAGVSVSVTHVAPAAPSAPADEAPADPAPAAAA